MLELFSNIYTTFIYIYTTLENKQNSINQQWQESLSSLIHSSNLPTFINTILQAIFNFIIFWSNNTLLLLTIFIIFFVILNFSLMLYNHTQKKKVNISNEIYNKLLNDTCSEKISRITKKIINASLILLIICPIVFSICYPLAENFDNQNEYLRAFLMLFYIFPIFGASIAYPLTHISIIVLCASLLIRILYINISLSKKIQNL